MQFHHLVALTALPILASATLHSLPPPHPLNSLSSSSSSLSSSKREDISITWGPIFYLEPGTGNSEIISAVSTTYPGKMPTSQAGGLFLWPGITNGTGSLIQSIIGSYSAAQSECGGQGTGSEADSEWCISSEVYGLNDQGVTAQFVGTLLTLDDTPEGGLVFNYTLVDRENYVWNQTVHDATTGVLMSTYQSTEDPMTSWNTAVECQSCTPTISEQTCVNTIITLNKADLSFGEALYTTDGTTYSEVTTADGGVTWTVDLISMPAMDNSTSTSS